MEEKSASGRIFTCFREQVAAIDSVFLFFCRIFDSEDPKRFVKKWSKFKELIFILGASLREIDESWGHGKGRLSSEFPAEQVKALVRALFQNTERRAAILARIK